MDALSAAELADMVAQAVIDRLEERRQVEILVDMVLRRITEIQPAEAPAVLDPLAAAPRDDDRGKAPES